MSGRIALLPVIALSLLSFVRADDSPKLKRKSPRAHNHAHVHDHAHASVEDSNSDSEDPAVHARQATTSERWPLTLLGGYCALLIGAAVFGGWAPQRLNLSHMRMQTIMSFVAGLMLGIAVLHMLPHSLVILGRGGPDISARWLIGGLLVMFFLLRSFHFHEHGSGSISREEIESGPCEHGHAEHDHFPSPPDSIAKSTIMPQHAHRLSWVGVFLGLSLHTLIDGLALGASVEADAAHGSTGLLGLGTFLAIFLHIPLDSISITSLMAASGYKASTRSLACAAFSLLCPLGAVAFVFGMHQIAGQQPAIVGAALAFSAGVFLCIALSDLLPEMEFHAHNRVRLSVALLLGIALAWGIGLVEPDHVHGHDHGLPTDIHAR